MIQILAIIYNVGHYYNTFTALRAVIGYASNNNHEKMVRKLEHDQLAGEYFETCFMNPASALNKRYGTEMDYDTEEMLKLIYTKEQAPIA